MRLSPPDAAPLKSWRSLKALRANCQDYVAGMEKYPLALSRYVETGIVHNAYTMAPVEHDLPASDLPISPSADVFLTSGLSIYACMTRAKQQLVDESAQSPAEWAVAVLSRELYSLLCFRVEAGFPARFGRTLGQMSIESAGWLGLAAGIGAMEVVERWAPLLVEAVRRGYVIEHNQCGMHHFILRLWCASRGLDYPQTGYPTFEVAEGVLGMWDTPDVEMLGTWLVQLCNQHTQLTRQKQFMDFVNDFSHIPVEVMLLFRLRELKGLDNPVVDHPLMKFPWSKLWLIQKALPDELLQGVYRRLECDEGITVENLYRKFF